MKRALHLAVPVIVAIVAMSSARSVRGQTPITLGSEVEVAGTGDCLNARWEASTAGPINTCLVDGTRARVDDLHDYLDQHWSHLAGYGWVADQYLRQTAAPEPDLEEYAGPRPSLPGTIAYAGEDGNVWLASPDGSRRWRLTTDGTAGYQGVRYDGVQWSPDGRFLAFGRYAPGPPPDINGSPFIRVRVQIVDSFNWHVKTIEPAAGRDMTGWRWTDKRHLLVVDGIEKSRNVCPSPPHDAQILLVDVLTDERRAVAKSSRTNLFLGRIVGFSPDGTRVAFSESSGCEGAGIACAARGVDETRCIDEGGWAIVGWISNTEVLLHDAPYPYPVNLKPAAVFDANSGAVRTATPGEDRPLTPEPGPLGGQLTYDDVALDFRLDGHDALHVPTQQHSYLLPHALSPDQRAFVLTMGQHGQSVRSIWVAMADGSQRAWPLIEAAASAVWQPAVPVSPALRAITAVRRVMLMWRALADAR